MWCDSLECYSTAVARSKISGRVYCCTCATKLSGQNGPKTMESLPGAKFPWEVPVEKNCPHCGIGYNGMVIAMTGDCPACKKPLPEFKK